MTIAYMASVLDHGADGRGALDRRAEHAEPELAVDLGPDRVVDPSDDLVHVEDVLGDLRGHDVAVVALRHGDEAVRLLGAGAAQEVGLHAVADHEAAPEAVLEDAPGREPAEGAGIAVDDGHLVPAAIELLGEARADSAAADDEDLHRALF